jgi:acetylornithine/N-succinyldiaminopimelate aminotransferase
VTRISGQQGARIQRLLCASHDFGVNIMLEANVIDGEMSVSPDTKTLLEWSTKYHTPNYSRAPTLLVRGDGVRVWDADGREYLDFTSGFAVTSLGHCHPVITGAIREAAATLLHVSNMFHSAPQIHLAKVLVENSFADRVFFANSGAEANEAAIKLARRYGKERGASDRYEIIATRNGFHGRTLATLSATGQGKFQYGFEPLVQGFKHVPYNNLRAMERAIDSHTAAILVEPIQGEGGVHVAEDDYLRGLRKLCDETGALLIFDEIQTGVGRTGRLWAYEHAGVEPDVMTLAKALANGVPIGAMLCREGVASVLTPGSHGSTFGGTPFVTSVALATLTTVIGERLPERAARTGHELMDGLRKLQARLPVIRDVRGRGLLIGVELTRPAGPIVDACREAGLLVLMAGDQVLRLTPPLIVSPADCARALQIIGTVLES